MYIFKQKYFLNKKHFTMNYTEVIAKAKNELKSCGKENHSGDYSLKIYDIVDKRHVCSLDEFPEHMLHEFSQDLLENCQLFTFETIKNEGYHPEQRVWHYETIDLIRGMYDNKENLSSYHSFPEKNQFQLGNMSHLCSLVSTILSGKHILSPDHEKRHVLATGSLVAFDTGSTQYISFPGFDLQKQRFQNYPLGLGSLDGFPAHEYVYLGEKLYNNK